MQLFHDVKENFHGRSYTHSLAAYRLLDSAAVGAHHQAVTLGDAIREVRGPMTQDELARAVGTDQGTVSKWESGRIWPGYDDLPKIEKAAGVPRGTILRRAGYVAEIRTLDDWLEADSTIPRPDLDVIRAAIAAARKRRP